MVIRAPLPWAAGHYCRLADRGKKPSTRQRQVSRRRWRGEKADSLRLLGVTRGSLDFKPGWPGSPDLEEKEVSIRWTDAEAFGKAGRMGVEVSDRTSLHATRRWREKRKHRSRREERQRRANGLAQARVNRCTPRGPTRLTKKRR